MADSAEKDQSLLLDMLLAARDARAFVTGMDADGFRLSRLHQNAVIRSLEVIGEAAGNVSLGFQSAHPELPWREITGMRHRLIHGYAEVDLNLVWSVVSTKIGPLIAMLSPLIPPEGAPEA